MRTQRFECAPVESDDVDSLDAHLPRHLHHSQADHTVCSVLNDPVSGLELLKLSQQEVRGGRVDGQGGGVRRGDVVGNLEHVALVGVRKLSPRTERSLHRNDPVTNLEGTDRASDLKKGIVKE